jgi:hypothetical protein
MRRLLIILFCCALTACSSGGDDNNGTTTATTVKAPTTTTIPVAQLRDLASQITDLMIAGKWDDVVSHFNAEMLMSMSAPSLKTAWEQVTGEFGAYKQRGATARSTTAAPNGVVVFDTPMSFEKAAMKSRISFDRDGKVAGLFILKANVA